MMMVARYYAVVAFGSKGKLTKLPLVDRRIFFTNDIIGVLHHKGEPQANPGERYRITVSIYTSSSGYNQSRDDWNAFYNDASKWVAYLSCHNQNGPVVTGPIFSVNQIMLFKRPFRNWIRYFIFLITKTYDNK